MPEQPPARELCAAGARRRGDPQFATASRVDLWLVLEVPGPWADEVGDSLDPASPIGRALLPVVRAVPRTRVLFIKGAPRSRGDTFAFYVAVTDEAAPRLYRFELKSHAALAEIDLFGVLAGETRYDVHRDPRPLYLICTHGTHDRCCAKFGFPIYRYLEQQEPECVWQSSHVGGDRFAANLVCLPHGLYYGQVETSDADAIRAGAAAGSLHLPSLRGRACYPMPVQAAEHFLRQARGETALAAYRLWSYQGAGTVTEAAFLATGEDRLHTVRVEAAPLDGLRFLTCDSCEEKVAMSYRLLDHQEAPFVPETHRAGELEYALRPAAMRDYGFIYCLRRDTLTHYLDGMAMPAEERGPFFARFDVGRHRLITLGEASVGAVSVVQREAGLHLANLHLLPAYQSRGLGTAIIRDLQARATAAGLPLTTQALKVNPACAFYQRLGFRIVGDTGIRYRLIWEG